MTVQEQIHNNIVARCDEVSQWFAAQGEGLAFPFYSSFDLRDSSYKAAPVDANIFPAGFNNICQVDKESAAELARQYISQHYPQARNVMLLTEEHTNNAYYWENVFTLQAMITEAGYQLTIAIAQDFSEPMKVKTISGREITVHSARRQGSTVSVDGATPDLVISNNDFSDAHENWTAELNLPVNPPYELGWYRRRKDHFFHQYNQLAEEFSRLISIDPWQIQVRTDLFSGFDVNDEASRDQLAQTAQKVIDELRTGYRERGISQEPFVFIKNNSGTYGLGVIMARSGDEIRQWNYKSRKKMKAVKGGGHISEVIIQEGIPTLYSSPGETSEPAIYMIGCQLAGGFLRSHKEKGPEDNLNSPGAVFKRLCVSDLAIKTAECPMENVYGSIAKLGFLAIAREAKANGIGFKGYV